MIPPLITTEGLVLNNQMPDSGALGGYTPPGTASSEGISLMLRGVVRAAIATGDSAKTAFAKFLFDAACTYFFRGERPTASTTQVWNHSWINNGGKAFNVRGPLQSSGDLALSGYLFGRNAESSVNFVNGVGQLSIPPDIIYQVVTGNTEFVWDNMFADLTVGTRLAVEYYIDSGGNKVFGSQKGGSFGQPAIPAGEHSDGDPGKIKLRTPENGLRGVNFSVTVPEVSIAYGELYEAWPMWRKLYDDEVSTAGDAIHWFLDAFALGMQLEPSNLDWKNGYDRMIDVWNLTCTQESNNTRIFQAGTEGPYNNFPLTYGYAYGRENIDDDTSNWSAVPPTDRYTAERGSDGKVAFTMPAADAAVGSGLPIRYGVAFENSPLFQTYLNTSRINIDSSSTVDQTVALEITGTDGVAYEAQVLIGPNSGNQSVSITEFFKFQQEAGDSLGEQSGDWTTDPGNPELPEPGATPFPGSRLALLGDSITEYNTGYYPPNGTGRYEYFAWSMCGYMNYALGAMGQRLQCEPGTDIDRTSIGYKRGRNWGVAGSKVANWWDQTFEPLVGYGLRDGPMYLAKTYLTDFDVAYIMGGTNDLSGNAHAADVIYNLKRAAAELAAAGKWVFVGAIPPRTRDLLAGYSAADQDAIRARIIQVNTEVKAYCDATPNIWFVDYYDDLLGPNGIDPSGWQSSSDGVTASTKGNYKVGYEGLITFHDGLHPAPLGAYLMGLKIAQVMIAAGVPTRAFGGTDVSPNKALTFSTLAMSDAAPLSTWNRIGWATGLGAKTISGGNHAGFTYGKLPDFTHFYRGTNQATESIGAQQDGQAGTYSNFMAYSWSAFAYDQQYAPIIGPRINDSTWADGAVNVQLLTDSEGRYLQIDVNIPAGTDPNNRNQVFVLNQHVPTGQHGPWDLYGYKNNTTGVRTDPSPNYVAGDAISAMADVEWEFSSGLMHGARFIINMLSVNLTDYNTSGAVISGIQNSHNFWPPSELDKIHMPRSLARAKWKTPKVKATAAGAGETSRYCQLRFEFGWDTYQTPVVGTIKIRAPQALKN